MFFSRLRRMPQWVMWTFGLFIATLYVCLFYHFFIGSLSIRWQALYGSVPEPDPQTYPVRGIDISHYQSQINWNRLRKANITNHHISFIFIKATEGTDFLDKAFTTNFRQAQRIGLLRGAYHYFKPNIDAAQQAKFYIEHVDLSPGDRPPVLDIEEIGNLTKSQLKRAVLCWLTVCEAYYGVKPIIYAGFKFRETYLDDPAFDTYPYWIAHYYRSELSYQADWHFWQYNDCGVIDGINGSVDFDVFNGDMERLQRMTIRSILRDKLSSELEYIDTLHINDIEEINDSINVDYVE